MISFKSVLLTSCLDWFGFSARLNPGLLFGDQSPSKDLSYFWWWARSPVGLIKSSSLHPAVSYSATVLYWLLHLLRNTAAAFWLSPAFKKSRRCAEYLHCTFAIRLQGRIGLIQHEQQHIATMTKHSYSDHILSNWSYHIISYHIISYHITDLLMKPSNTHLYSSNQPQIEHKVSAEQFSLTIINLSFSPTWIFPDSVSNISSQCLVGVRQFPGSPDRIAWRLRTTGQRPWFATQFGEITMHWRMINRMIYDTMMIKLTVNAARWFAVRSLHDHKAYACTILHDHTTYLNAVWPCWGPREMPCACHWSVLGGGVQTRWRPSLDTDKTPFP